MLRSSTRRSACCSSCGSRLLRAAAHDCVRDHRTIGRDERGADFGSGSMLGDLRASERLREDRCGICARPFGVGAYAWSRVADRPKLDELDAIAAPLIPLSMLLPTSVGLPDVRSWDRVPGAFRRIPAHSGAMSTAKITSMARSLLAWRRPPSRGTAADARLEWFGLSGREELESPAAPAVGSIPRVISIPPGWPARGHPLRQPSPGLLILVSWCSFLLDPHLLPIHPSIRHRLVSGPSCDPRMMRSACGRRDESGGGWIRLGSSRKSA